MKKFILMMMGMVICGGIGVSSTFAQNAPNYDTYFAGSMTQGENSVRNPSRGTAGSDVTVSSKKSLKENIKTILSPGITNGGFVGQLLQTIAIGVLVLFLVIAGVQLLIHGHKSEELQTALRNLGYIALGALFVYAAGWLFGEVLNIETLSGGEGYAGGSEAVVHALVGGSTSIGFQVLALLKGAAFFRAILMIVITGFKVIAAADAEKSKKLVKGILNVVAALVIMKMVDFVYYMVSAENFATQAAEFILSAVKFFGYLYGALVVLIVFYAGYSFLTDAGSGAGVKRAQTLLINVLVSGLVLFGFLLILYQIFAQFAS